MPVHRGLVVVAVALAAGLATSVLTPAASAQWLPDHPYSIRRLGLFGPEYVGSAGYSNSTVFALSVGGHACGTSERVDALAGQAAWAYNPVTGAVGRIAPTASEVGTRQVDAIDFQTGTGQVAGTSQWISNLTTSLGARTWVHVPATATENELTNPTGLTSSEFFYTVSGLPPGSDDVYMFSEHRVFNDAGWIAGVSRRFQSNGDAAGQGVWVYNPLTRLTVRTGLFDSTHTLTGDVQSSEIRDMTPGGQVVGISARREDPVQQRIRQSVWVYRPATDSTVPLGAQFEAEVRDVDFQNALGHIAARASTPASQTASEKQTTLAFDPLDGTQTRTGLLSAGYGDSSNHFSASAFQNSKGDLTGITRKFVGPVQIGQNAWFYNATTRTSTAIGLTGAAYTGVAGPGDGGGVVLPAGYQYSEPRGIDGAGRACGISARITGANTHNGQNAWLYRPTTNSTVQIGLSGAWFVGSAGYQFSEVLQQNEQTGRVVGFTRLIAGVNDEIGQNLWTYDPGAQQAKRAGLSGPAWQGSSGAEFTEFSLMNDSGGIAGSCKRFTGVSTEEGQNTWVWLPQQLSAVQTGLTTAAHTAGAYQFSQNISMDQAGRVVGLSQRLDGFGMENGQNIWVYNPATNTTVQTGLTTAAHTGTGGYQHSDFVARNPAGQMVGTSRRITGASTFNGDQDVWYYDAATGVTHAVVGMVLNNRAFAEPTVLTDDGTLFGRYAVYSGPGGTTVSLRAFAFRPDRGFADLWSLGLAGSAWSSLQSPEFANSVNQVVGLGLATVGLGPQTSGQSVFLMVPASCPSDLGRQGGLPGADGALDNNDFIVFIDYFFSMNPLADVGVQGGLPGHDSLLDNNDFIVFIDQYFAGCQ